MSNVLHVVPVNDLIDHDTNTDEAECICGPWLELVDECDGDAWLIVHNSLDGRELKESL